MDDSNPKVLLKDIIIDSQNTAISVMAGMLEIAQSRGTFNMEESAKIWEDILHAFEASCVYNMNYKSKFEKRPNGLRPRRVMSLDN